MTLLMWDGFDIYVNPGGEGTNNLWDSAAPTTGSPTRFGVGSATNLANGSELPHTLGANTQELIFIAAWSKDAVASSGKTALISIYDGTTRQCTICAETDGSYTLRRGNTTGTIVAQTATGLFVGNSIYKAAAFRVKLHGTTGEFQVWHEGASVLNVSGLNNISTANAYATKIALAASDGNSGHYMYCDDFALLDTAGVAPLNAFLGDIRAYFLMPSGAGSSTQFTPDSGSNYARVNEVNAQDDLNYVASSNAGDKDLYALDNLPGGLVATIFSVQLHTRSRKDDAGVRQIASTIKSSSATQDGATQTLGGSYAGYVDRFDKDPNGTVDWTVAAVNAIEIGVKVIA